MDDKGHVHLADFNIATHLHAHRPLTSNSGTGYYIGKKNYYIMSLRLSFNLKA
jgi:serine/threonine kinase 32